MKLIQYFSNLFFPDTSDQVRHYKGMHLPVTRSNEGLSDDLDYVNSALEQIDSLSQYCELTPHTRILDFGCGQGRLANGIILKIPNIEYYCGIDTNQESINWCKRWLYRYHKNFNFIHVPAYNERYNQSAESHPALPVKPDSFDIAFLNSVFSHMLVPDITFYLSQLHNSLCNGGVIYLTAFIEEDVPNVEENPPGYLNKTSTGALHRVRYDKAFFLNLVEKAGFRIIDFQYQIIKRTQQSVVVAKKPA